MSFPKNNGFTILEVVVAATVLSIGLLGVGRLMIGSMNANKTSHDMSIATTLAQEKIENLKQMAYLGIGMAGDTLTEPYGTILNHPSFERVVEISSVSGTSGVKSVTVRVSWKHLHHHSVELKTLMPR